MKAFCARIVKHSFFEKFIITLIVINGVVLGLETSTSLMDKYEHWFKLISDLILLAFVIEAIMKITAVAPRFKLYFGNAWNVFDFSVVLLSLIPSTGEFAMIARLARLLRVMRLISTIPSLRLIVETLMRSLPGMMHVIMLMGVIFYVYAIAGYHLFHQHDPQLWGTLGTSMLTLFRVVTLEDWTDVMYTAMELHSMAWIFFVSFVIVGTFVVINLFIAVVLNNLEEAKQEKLEKIRQPMTKDDLYKELKATQEALRRLQTSMESMDVPEKSTP